MNTVGMLGDKIVIFVTKPLTKVEALQLAVDIVLLADGSLVAESDNNGVVKWNTDSEFHKVYAARFAE